MKKKKKNQDTRLPNPKINKRIKETAIFLMG